MERPTIDAALVVATATAGGWTEEEAGDIALVCFTGHEDGYELAKALDSECGWFPSADDVRRLAKFGCDLRDALSKARLDQQNLDLFEQQRS